MAVIFISPNGNNIEHWKGSNFGCSFDESGGYTLLRNSDEAHGVWISYVAILAGD